jgi:HD domain
LARLRPAVRHCRERYDGRGYPDRLAGEEIPLEARVLAVAEACDALLSERPHRQALGRLAAAQALRAGAGTQWDPRVVEALLAGRADLLDLGGPQGPGAAVAPVPDSLESWGPDESAVPRQKPETVTTACQDTVGPLEEPGGSEDGLF